MFFCRLTQERQTKIVTQIAAQMSEALKREDDRFARDVAKKEAEYQKKCKEKEAKEKAAIESICEYRATVVRNLRLFSFLFTPAEEPGPDHSWCLRCQASACFSRSADILPGVPSATSLLGAHLPGMLKTLRLGTGQPQWSCSSQHWYRAASAQSAA